MRGIVRFVALLLMAVTLVAQSAKEPQAVPYEVAEAYKVYAAVLGLEAAEGDLLIADTTVPFKHCLEARSDKPVDNSIGDYKKANQRQWKLERKFDLKQDYKLLSKEEIERLRKPDPNGGFFWRLPQGVEIRHFSAVGFNRNKTVAFVEMDVQCGGLCGHGSPYVLEKHDGKWQEYSGPPWKVIKRKKIRNGEYEETVKPNLSTCMWAY